MYSNNFMVEISIMPKLNEKLFFQPCQFFYYMTLSLSAGTFCQISLENTIGVPAMLDNYLCSCQTRFEVLSWKELTVLQNNYR